MKGFPQQGQGHFKSLYHARTYSVNQTTIDRSRTTPTGAGRLSRQLGLIRAMIPNGMKKRKDEKRVFQKLLRRLLYSAHCSSRLVSIASII